jgi:H+/Cl- antiporter ClcA
MRCIDDEDVGPPNKPLENLLRTRSFQIERNSTLVSISQLEGIRLFRTRLWRDLLPVSPQLPIGRLDFDDFCAEVRQNRRRTRASDEAGSITPWLLVATLAAALVGVWTMRMMLGNGLDFEVRQVSFIEAWRIGPFLALGALLGAVGALYNVAVAGLLRFADRLDRFPHLSSTNRAAIIGAMVGLTAWFAPAVVGGGNMLTQTVLADRYAIGGLLMVFLARFLLGPWSYAAGAPGGLFAPLLVLGASSGGLFAGVLNHFVPLPGFSPIAFAVVGMAAMFSASVRAPLTGIVLTIEMTGRGDLTLGLLGASLAAMLVAILLQSEPIYETLKRRMLAKATETSGLKGDALQALSGRNSTR